MSKLGRVGVVICSRPDSSRVYRKCFADICGKPLLARLMDRLDRATMVAARVIAVPLADTPQYEILQVKNREKPWWLYGSKHGTDPLARTAEVATALQLDTIIRVCHDKVFVDAEMIDAALRLYASREETHYLYPAGVVPGASFEIISNLALQDAAQRFKGVEHISYAIRSVLEPEGILAAEVPVDVRDTGDVRLLVDYPQDLVVLRNVVSKVNPEAPLAEVVKYAKAANLKRINGLPKLTVYTCAYNAAKHLSESLSSAVKLKSLIDTEILFVDDASTDATSLVANDFEQELEKHFILSENVGLASASNIALSNARGKWVMRLDADDYLVSAEGVLRMIELAERDGLDAVYPDYYLGGTSDHRGDGKQHHHIGGALFNTRAINQFKFQEQLRGYDGLEFFERARKLLKIGYYSEPVFVYRQTPGSMSKTNLPYRRDVHSFIRSIAHGEGIALPL